LDGLNLWQGTSVNAFTLHFNSDGTAQTPTKLRLVLRDHAENPFAICIIIIIIINRALI